MEPGTWDRVNASDWEVWDVEQSGSSEATWLLEPLTGERWLHKDTKIPSTGIEQGEEGHGHALTSILGTCGRWVEFWPWSARTLAATGFLAALAPES